MYQRSRIKFSFTPARINIATTQETYPNRMSVITLYSSCDFHVVNNVHFVKVSPSNKTNVFLKLGDEGSDYLLLQNLILIAIVDPYSREFCRSLLITHCSPFIL